MSFQSEKQRARIAELVKKGEFPKDKFEAWDKQYQEDKAHGKRIPKEAPARVRGLVRRPRTPR